MVRSAVVGVAFALCACGRTELVETTRENRAPDGGAPLTRDAGLSDAGRSDAGDEVDAGDACAELNTAIVGNLEGYTTYAYVARPLPAGEYDVIQIEGCMQYQADGGWTVQPTNPDDGWWIVTTGADGSNTKLLRMPGTEGLIPGQGAFATFEECVNANRQPRHDAVLHFPGGPMGFWLKDDSYADNSSHNGRNPMWQVTCLSLR